MLLDRAQRRDAWGRREAPFWVVEQGAKRLAVETTQPKVHLVISGQLQRAER